MDWLHEGSLRRRRGDEDGALEAYQQAVQAARGSFDRATEAAASLVIGELRLLKDDFRGARAALESAPEGPKRLGCRGRWIDWADLLKRVWTWEVLACACGATRRVMAAVQGGPVAEKSILNACVRLSEPWSAVDRREVLIVLPPGPAATPSPAFGTERGDERAAQRGHAGADVGAVAPGRRLGRDHAVAPDLRIPQRVHVATVLAHAPIVERAPKIG